MEQTLTYNSAKLEVKETLTLKEINRFVADVCALMFNDDGGYYPQYYDFAINYAVFTHYTNLLLPDDPQEQYVLCCLSDLAEQVIQQVNQVQYKRLMKDVEDMIAFRREKAVHYSPLSKLLDGIEGFASKMQDTDMRELLGLLGKIGEMDEKAIVDAVIDRKVENGEVAE